MTQILPVQKTCFSCGQPDTYEEILSTNTLGPSDLDTRPAEMARSTIAQWIQACASCGYCSPDISKGPEGVEPIIKKKEYAQQRCDSSFQELANRFLCSALISEASGDLRSAGWAAVHAAWVCDDAKETDGAARCRKRATEIFHRARKTGVKFTEQAGGEEALLADLLRRNQEFVDSQSICEQGLSKQPDPILESVLRFQLVLCDKKDSACHSLNEVVESR
jgi:hypothetical protein